MLRRDTAADWPSRDGSLVGPERPRRDPATQEGEQREQAQPGEDEAPVDAGAERRAAGLDGPVDGVVVGDRRDPAGISSRCMNAGERNVSGSCRNVTAPIRVSSWRVTSASALDSARERGAEQAGGEHERRDAEDARRTSRRSRRHADDHERLDQRLHEVLPHAARRSAACAWTGVTSSRSMTPRSRSSIAASRSSRSRRTPS